MKTFNDSRFRHENDHAKCNVQGLIIKKNSNFQSDVLDIHFLIIQYSHVKTSMNILVTWPWPAAQLLIVVIAFYTYRINVMKSKCMPLQLHMINSTSFIQGSVHSKIRQTQSWRYSYWTYHYRRENKRLQSQISDTYNTYIRTPHKTRLTRIHFFRRFRLQRVKIDLLIQFS